MAKSAQTSQSKAPSQPPAQLQLHGQVVKLTGKKAKKPKYLYLATTDGIKSLKLAKSIRKSVPKHIQPGQWVSVTGKVKQSHPGKPWRYKAKSVKPAAPQSVDYRSSPTVTPPTTTSSTPAVTPVVTPPPPPAEAKPAAKTKPPTVLICRKSKCCKRGAVKVTQRLEQELNDRDLSDRVKLKPTGCMSRCKQGPNLVIMPGKTKLTKVKPGDVPQLVDQLASRLPD